MRLAICPGSFDPITKGHLDIIRRASKLFDQVTGLVSVNAEKNAAFSVEERIDMIKISTKGFPNVTVDFFDGLLVDYVKSVGACAIVKGLRAISDFEYEFQMALANKQLYDQAETVFFTTSAENMYLSSSLVRQIASFGGDVSGSVPEEIVDIIKKRLCKRECVK